MDVLTTVIALSGALLALTLSVISLVLHWVRGHESPEVSEISRRITDAELSILNVMDQVKHWRGRDNVRRARLGAEEKAAKGEPQPEGAPLDKAALRTIAASRGLGIANS